MSTDNDRKDELDREDPQKQPENEAAKDGETREDSAAGEARKDGEAKGKGDGKDRDNPFFDLLDTLKDFAKDGRLHIESFGPEMQAQAQQKERRRHLSKLYRAMY